MRDTVILAMIRPRCKGTYREFFPSWSNSPVQRLCQFVRHLGSWKVFSELTATKSLTLRISQGGNYKGYVKKVFPPPL
jgi:hypothetical protein